MLHYFKVMDFILIVLLRCSMKQSKTITNNRQVDLSRFCAAMGNPNRIVILETLASQGYCVKDDFLEIEGLSKFTVGMNLKYLKKFGLINGSFTSRNLSYCVDYEKLEDFKLLFDGFYNTLMENKDKVNPQNTICGNIK